MYFFVFNHWLNSTLFVNTKITMCVCCVYMWVGYPCVHMWKPEVEFRCPLPSFSILLSETGSLTVPGTQ